jgi:hypothetical protein
MVVPLLSRDGRNPRTFGEGGRIRRQQEFFGPKYPRSTHIDRRSLSIDQQTCLGTTGPNEYIFNEDILRTEGRMP